MIASAFGPTTGQNVFLAYLAFLSNEVLYFAYVGCLVT